MSTKSKIAAFATLATLIAAPAFAGDQDTATELQDSGRYIGVQVVSKSGIYASARGNRARTQEQASPNGDFQLVGHN